MLIDAEIRVSIFPDMSIDYSKINRLRVKAGMSFAQAAKAAGMKSRQQWYNVETARNSPTVETLAKIAAALGVKTKDLLK